MKKPQIPIDAAREQAEAFISEIAPYVDRVTIAGSIRRGKRTVSDIEVVAIPRLHALQADLFGGMGGPEVDELHDHIEFMVAHHHGLSIRILDDGSQRFGDRTKFLVWNGIPLDLFSVKPPAQWGALFAIRTGPHKFSQLCVTSRAAGGAMPMGIRQQNGTLWRGDPERGGVVIETAEESDWFATLGLPCWEPAERTERRLKDHLTGARS